MTNTKAATDFSRGGFCLAISMGSTVLPVLLSVRRSDGDPDSNLVVLLVICLIESALAAINGDSDTPSRRDGLGRPCQGWTATEKL